MQELTFPLQAVFVAIPLESEAKREFQRLQEGVRDYAHILTFQNPQSPHLTLYYWKELMQIEYKQIMDQLPPIAEKFPSFTLKVEGVETFGHRGRETVLYLTIPFSDELARVKKACPWPSVEAFHPHVTLARIKHSQRFDVEKKKIMKLLGDVSFTMNVDRIRLYAMVDGKRQTPLQDFEF
jgi:2'-5' RNA ligase